MSDVSDPNPDVERVDLQSLDVAEQKRHELLRLFPEVRTEGGKIDLDRLKLALGMAVDVGKERYGLTWPGKAECFRTIQRPSTATLRPLPEESVNFDTTENLIIEGDNLEVLKLLQKAYLGQVKMIYIDPPYNTGNDFIYPDNYAESLQTYLEYTSQVDAEGKKFSTNTESDGRFHSKWLNMLYPRLQLARNLLAPDGAIFISIDDKEIPNLRKVCDEVFGEENFKGTIVRATGQTTGQDSGGLGSSFDYIVVYFRDPDTELSGLGLTDDDIQRYQDEDKRGKYALWQLRKTGSNDRRADRPNMFFAVTDPDGNKVLPLGPGGYESCWRFDPKGYERLVREDYIVWKKRRKGESEEWWPYVKTYLEGRTKRPSPLWTDIEGSKKGSIDLRDLMGASVFDNPKPIGLVKRLLQIAPGDGKDALVLDFFAGAGTTAQAVLEANREDGGRRRFILVQLPERCPEDSDAYAAGYRRISDITKERVRRVGARMDKEAQSRLNDGSESVDWGFRAFSLAESNFLTWDSGASAQTHELEEQLSLHVQHVRAASTSDDLLFEILLKEGFPPTTRFETVGIASLKAQSVADGALIVCLSRNLELDAIRAIADRGPQRVVCLDEGFAGNDQLKANAVQIFKTKGIVFRTV